MKKALVFCGVLIMFVGLAAAQTSPNRPVFSPRSLVPDSMDCNGPCKAIGYAPSASVSAQDESIQGDITWVKTGGPGANGVGCLSLSPIEGTYNTIFDETIDIPTLYANESLTQPTNYVMGISMSGSPYHLVLPDVSGPPDWIATAVNCYMYEDLDDSGTFDPGEKTFCAGVDGGNRPWFFIAYYPGSYAPDGEAASFHSYVTLAGGHKVRVVMELRTRSFTADQTNSLVQICAPALQLAF